MLKKVVSTSKILGVEHQYGPIIKDPLVVNYRFFAFIVKLFE